MDLRSVLRVIRRHLMLCGDSLRARGEEVPIFHSAPAIGTLESKPYMFVDEWRLRSQCW